MLQSCKGPQPGDYIHVSFISFVRIIFLYHARLSNSPLIGLLGHKESQSNEMKLMNGNVYDDVTPISYT